MAGDYRPGFSAFSGFSGRSGFSGLSNFSGFHLPALVGLVAALHGDVRHVLLGRLRTLDHGAEVLIAEVARELAPAFAGLAHESRHAHRNRARMLAR